MKIRVRVSNHAQFGRLARRLRAAADGGLKQDLGAELQRAAPPVLAKVQAAVQQASFPAEEPSPNHRTRSTGLRDRLAAATKTEPLSAPVGVRFLVDGSVVNPADSRGGHKLAKYTDVELAPRWRHQTFGRTGPEDWFNQLGQPWFAVSIRPQEPRFRRGVEKAMDKTIRRIV